MPRLDDVLREKLPGEENTLQEERRLFYVAITRTTNTLVLSSVVRLPRETAYAMRVPVRGRSRQYAQTVSSRFLIELGQALPAAVRGEQWLAQTQ